MTQSATEFLSGQRQDHRLQIGLFDVDHLRFGIEIKYLSEVCVAGSLLSMVTARPEVLGMLNLRGSMIPVVDPMALCGLGQCSTAPNLVAVLIHNSRLIGLAVNATGGISSYDAALAQNLYLQNEGRLPLVRRGLLDDGTAVNIFEASRVFDELDMPTCAAKQEAGRLGATRRQTAYLTFEAGGATFGMEAVEIFGTVPRQTINPGPVSGSRCLGLIEYLGRKVPVVDCAKLVGLGSGEALPEPEVVVVRLEDERVAGLAVDVISRIELIETKMLKPPPDHLKQAAPTVSGFFAKGEDTQIFILDVKRLNGLHDIKQIAEISQVANDRKPHVARGDTECTPQDDVGDRIQRRCLIYTAGRRQTTDLTQVLSILELPGHITPIQDPNPAVEGLFVHAGASVLLVNLANFSGGQEPRDRANARVLLVEGTAGFVGFLVDSVDGIQSSDLVISKAGDPIGPMARLGQGSEERALPFVDLETVAASVSAQP